VVLQRDIGKGHAVLCSGSERQPNSGKTGEDSTIILNKLARLAKSHKFPNNN